MDAELAAGVAPSLSRGGGGAQRVFAGAGPVQRPSPPDYYALPVGVKAAILSRLCDHLLDCTTVR